MFFKKKAAKVIGLADLRKGRVEEAKANFFSKFFAT